MTVTMTGARPIRATRGPELTCKGWEQEAALRMLMNNLDPEVAEDPDNLVVYGGTGRAVRSWAAFDAIVRELRRLDGDETLLIQSGKPVGVVRTHPWAPRVLIANSNLVGKWANWEDFRRLEAMGLTRYGQMTAGSWIYIGTQGILQGTYETFAEAARRHFGGTLRGRVVLTAGLGGMGGAQPLAVTMNDGVCIAIEVDAARARRWLEIGYVDRLTTDPTESLAWARAAVQHGEARSIALVGNAAEIEPAWAAAGEQFDLVTDQTSAHDALGGYVPAEISLADALSLRTSQPDEYQRRARRSMADHVCANAAIETGTIGADAIKVAILYRPAAVSPVGTHAILDSAVDPRFLDTLNRPALAQTFDATGDGRLTIVVNHLKSKGSACPGDPDLGDGQGNCNQTRTAAADALVDWIASDPTGSGDLDVLVIGDLNSYAREDPIDVFTEAGYANLIDTFGSSGFGGGAYSYVFGGQTGYLDHALASPSLAAQVTGTAQWHVNADEPSVFDYNVEFKSAGQLLNLYAPDPYRSSDHDPVVIGMDLLDFGFSGFRPPVEGPPVRNVVKAGQTVPIRFVLGSGVGSGLPTGLESSVVLTSRAVSCATGLPIGTAAGITSPGRSALSPDPSTGIRTYLWKTDKAWANQCRSFILTLADGTLRHAAFDFRR